MTDSTRGYRRRLAELKRSALLAAAACGGGLSLSVPAQAQDILLADGNVVDVRTGISEVASVLVRNGVIQEVTGSPTVPPGVPVVDASGKWVIPGLIELHSHTVDPTALQRALALGVTSALTLYTGLEFLPPGLEDPSHVAGNPSPRSQTYPP